jgi:ABC-type multidrug transport system ATPase subunit
VTDSAPSRVAPASAPALSLAGVVRRFGATTAIDHLDLEVAAGEVVGLLGHNGAGKTTTVRLLAGLLAPDAGVVRVAGDDPVADGPAVRRRLGVLPSAPVVDARLTGVQNLRFAADVHGVPRDGLDQRIAAALATVELDGRGGERVAGYSTGMRHRLALARVLLPDPAILLLDEPTASLDPVAARTVRRRIAQLAAEQRRTVVLCTHDLAEADALCDRVVVLEHGRIVAQGSPAALAAAHGTGGLQLDVGPADVPTARELLVRLATGAVEVEGGGRLRASGVGRDAVPGLVRALAAAEVTVFEVRRLDPSLEDVYLALHERDREVSP